ncbi:MAG: LysR family transcriptional regulator [Mesorhizobium sp.]|uniref:LysR family transcriptional regulator n=1 Tax=Mesorhizobium sp. TaxID=1871066 RepID=UPI0011F64D91|nr:LysR substrate-binding domain-containing protein [Mesorhizobium sp.]TIR52781.1 MAG: LysR family transcriptional regulator [Mesorhizobium sp.]
MPDHILDLRLFRYALVSAEHGSFRRAAAVLNVQQSTVSRGVRSLEDRVRAKLFERDHSGIRPTSAGDRFLEEATLGFDHLRRAFQRAEAFQRGEHGKLTVGVSVPFLVLGDLFERFRASHSGVSVELVECTSGASAALVQQRSVDVVFVGKIHGNGPARSLYLHNEHMAAVLPKSHPLAGSRKLSFEELRHERFILTANGVGPDLQEHLAKRLAKPGAAPRVQLHRVGQCNLINMVALGFGVTIIVGAPPRAAVDDIVVVPLAGRNHLSLHAVWMDSNPNPALKTLLDIVRASASPCDAVGQH